jgi:ubiquinone/menaquinone biosynthesis C-methylase UbiE
MNKQEFYREKYRKSKLDWHDSLTIFRSFIDKEIKSDTRVLDIGCGHSVYLKDIFNKTDETYGIDSDRDSLTKNSIIRNKFIGNAEHLPFTDNFFDVIIMAWVIEHLANPEQVFKEIYRVLKPSGKVIFLSPNSRNYNIWLIRLIPQRFHDFFTKKLYARQENDTYKKYYKANSAKKINKLLTKIGFIKKELIINGDPSYISFNKILYKLACLVEKFLELKCFENYRVHLIGVFVK